MKTMKTLYYSSCILILHVVGVGLALKKAHLFPNKIMKFGDWGYSLNIKSNVKSFKFLNGDIDKVFNSFFIFRRIKERVLPWLGLTNMIV